MSKRVADQSIIDRMVILSDTTGEFIDAMESARLEWVNRQAGAYDNWTEVARDCAKGEANPAERFRALWKRAQEHFPGKPHGSAKVAVSTLAKALEHGVSLKAGRKNASFGLIRERTNAVSKTSLTAEAVNKMTKTAEVKAARHAQTGRKNAIGQPKRGAPHMPEKVGDRLADLQRALCDMDEKDAVALLDRTLAEAAAGKLPKRPKLRKVPTAEEA